MASLLQVSGGHESALAAALGWAGDALAVESVEHAARALTTLRDDDARARCLPRRADRKVLRPGQMARARRLGRLGT